MGCRELLRDRLMVGRQTLDLSIMVRIHVPQPVKFTLSDENLGAVGIGIFVQAGT